MIIRFDRPRKWRDRNKEVEVKAVNEEGMKILPAEAKWSNRPIGTNILDEINRKAALIDWNKGQREEYYCLFSKTGFTEAPVAMARNENIYLFQEDRLLQSEK